MARSINIEPIQDRLSLLDQESKILPSICALAAPGHTLGDMVVSVSSADEQLKSHLQTHSQAAAYARRWGLDEGGD